MAIVLLSFKYLQRAWKKRLRRAFCLLRGCPLLSSFYMTLWTNKYYTPTVTTIKRFLNLKRRLISWMGRDVWKLGISPWWYFWISPSLSGGCQSRDTLRPDCAPVKMFDESSLFLSTLDDTGSWRHNTCYHIERGFPKFMPFTPGHRNHSNKTENNRYHKLLSMFLSRNRSKWYFWARFNFLSVNCSIKWRFILFYIIPRFCWHCNPRHSPWVTAQYRFGCAFFAFQDTKY